MIENIENQSQLAAAVCRAIKATSWVKKDKETVGAIKFAYSSSEAILGHCRAALADEGLMVLVQPEGILELAPSKSARGNEIFRWLVKTRLTCLHAPSGESCSATYELEANDTGDKAALKAYTVSLRTFISKLLLLPAGDDPEDTQHDTDNSRRAEKPAVKSDSPAMLETRRIVAELDRLGLTGMWQQVVGAAKADAGRNPVEVAHVQSGAENLLLHLAAERLSGTTQRPPHKVLEELGLEWRKIAGDTLPDGWVEMLVEMGQRKETK